MYPHKAVAERRKFRRFRVMEGAIAELGPHCGILGQILDISPGGVAFRYIETEDSIENQEELFVFFAKRSFFLAKLPVISVSVTDIKSEFSFSSIPLRRCGLRFGPLRTDQKDRLNYFISHFTLNEHRRYPDYHFSENSLTSGRGNAGHIKNCHRIAVEN